MAELEVINGDTQTAREYIREALEKKNNYTAAVFLLAQIQINENQIPEAIQSVESATLLEPNNPAIFFQLGLLKYNQEDIEGAISSLEKALSINNVYANARYFLGLSYSKVGRTDDAIYQFEEIEKTNPDNEEVKLVLENLRSGSDPLEGFETESDTEERDGPPIEGE